MEEIIIKLMESERKLCELEKVNRGNRSWSSHFF